MSNEEFNQDVPAPVSPEIISAGVAVLDAFEGEVSKPTLAEWVYQAMQAAALQASHCNGSNR